MLYSHNNEHPAPLPHRILMSDGSTRTDKSSFTDEEIADAGYVAVDGKPPYAIYTQKVDWDNSSGKWVVVELSELELQALADIEWDSIREERDSLLAATDRTVLIHFERNEPVPDGLRNYRQSLRDLPQTYAAVGDIEWPARPANPL